MSVISESALQLRSTDSNHRTILLKINPNRYNRVALSANTGSQWLNADLTIDEWWSLCNYIRLAAAAPEPINYSIHLKKKDQVYGAVSVNVDEEGFIEIQLGNNGKGQLNFNFRPKRQFVHMCNGQPITTGKLSQIRAVNWANMMEPLVTKLWEAGYKAESVDKGMHQSGYKPNNQQRSNGGYGPQTNNYRGNDIDGDLEDYL